MWTCIASASPPASQDLPPSTTKGTLPALASSFGPRYSFAAQLLSTRFKQETSCCLKSHLTFYHLLPVSTINIYSHRFVRRTPYKFPTKLLLLLPYFFLPSEVANLDRLRAFKRRRESPTGSSSSSSQEDPKKTRSRSPAWLSKMHRNRSSSKRSGSPVGVASESSDVAQLDGSCFGKPAGAKYQDEPVQEGPPPLPSFLTLTEIGMLNYIL